MRDWLRVLAAACVLAAIGALVSCNKNSPTSPTQSSQLASCAFTVGDPPAGLIGAAGAEFTMTVSTSAGCSWTASSSASFITAVGPASGTGSGSVRFAVQSNTLSARQGTVTVAGRSVAIVQDGLLPPACEWTVNPLAASVPAAGSQLKVSVTSASGVDCTWTAASHDAFLSVQSGSAGIGSGATLLQVTPNGDSSARLGTVTVAGQAVSVLQESSAPSDCVLSVTPLSGTVPAAGGEVPITVTKTQGTTCPWIAETQSPFAIVDGRGGVNNGVTFIRMPPNGGAVARSATVLVAGRSVTITQPAPAVPCAFALGSAQGNVSSSGSTLAISIVKVQGDVCPWTAESQSSFLTIVSKNSGINDSSVLVSVAANTGDLRTGTVTAAGQTFTVVQLGPSTPCSYRLAPSSSISFGAAVSSTFVNLTTTLGENCPWTAQISAPFITVSPAGGTVNNLNPMISIFVSANSGPERSGTVTLAPGIVLTVTQAAALPSNAAAVVRLESDAADSILHGQSRVITLVGAQLETFLDPGKGSLKLNTAIGTSPPLQVRFDAPAGQSLAVGYYDHAQRFNFSPGQPGLDVSYNGSGCNDLTGRFLITEASFGTGGTVNRYHARFEQHCSGSSAALRGEVWIDAQGSTAPPTLAPFPPTPMTPATFFSFQSDPGDVLGQGQQRTYDLSSATFTPRFSSSEPDVSIGIGPSSGSLWNLEFKSPSGQSLTPGMYDPAGDPAASGSALLRVRGPGSCSGSTLTGKFTVLEAVYGTGGDVYRFHATFEARCGATSATLHGEIYIVADPWR